MSILRCVRPLLSLLVAVVALCAVAFAAPVVLNAITVDQVSTGTTRVHGREATSDLFESRRSVATLEIASVEPHLRTAIETTATAPLGGCAELSAARFATNSARRPIGFAPGAADLALSNVGRVDHASIHLIDEGLIAGSKGSTVARNGFRDAARPILENPLQTFDHVMAISGQAVKGFVGQINGQRVVIFVAKAPNGKISTGDIVTSVVPTPQQALNWGLN